MILQNSKALQIVANSSTEAQHVHWNLADWSDDSDLKL